MAIVSGLTAARMAEIVDETIVDATVVGNDLHLIRHDGGVINAGNVRGPTGAPGPAGPVDEAPEDNGYYVRRNGVWTLVNNSLSVASDLVSNVVKKYSAAIDHATAVTSTTPTLLATLSVPAVDVASVLQVSTWWNPVFHESDQFYMLIRVDGVQKAKQTIRCPGINWRTVFSIPSITPVTLAASAGATVTVLAARDTTNGGTGDLTQENPGVVTAEVIPT